MGYPTSANVEENKEDIYIVYRLEPEKTEPEWAQYSWNTSDIITQNGCQQVAPIPVKLTELMKKAGTADFQV